MKSAVLLICLSGAALVGCAYLPTSGPTAGEVIDRGVQENQIRYDVVDVDPGVVVLGLPFGDVDPGVVVFGVPFGAVEPGVVAPGIPPGEVEPGLVVPGVVAPGAPLGEVEPGAVVFGEVPGDVDPGLVCVVPAGGVAVLPGVVVLPGVELCPVEPEPPDGAVLPPEGEL